MRRRPVQLVLLAMVLAAPAAHGALHVLDVPQGWQYAPADDPPDAAKLPADWQSIELPHKLGTEPCGLYRARVALPLAWAGRRIEVVVRRSGGTVRVWADGKLLGVRSPSALDVRLDGAILQPGRAHSLLIAVSDRDSQKRPGLVGCRIEAGEPIDVVDLNVTTWPFAQGAVVDVEATVRNGGFEKLDSRLELALEPIVQEKHPVWRKHSDVRLDPGKSGTAVQSFEVERPVLWRFDQPQLYRLTATLRTRQDELLTQTVRRIGIRTVSTQGYRWVFNGEWIRPGGVSVQMPGLTLLCSQPGQAVSLLTRGQRGGVDKVLDFCDTEGILALLDASTGGDGVDGTLDDLAALARTHPCVVGLVADSETTLAALRQRELRLPVGTAMPEFATDKPQGDFAVARFKTKAERPDNDGYGRRMDGLRDDAQGVAILAIDSLTSVRKGDRNSVIQCLPRRRNEAARRPEVGALFFQLERDARLIEGAASQLSPVFLKDPHHEAKLDKDAIGLKTRFEVRSDSPVGGRMPCWSLQGARIAWKAGEASGVLDVPFARARALDGRETWVRAEATWRLEKDATVDFVAELQDAAGRVLGRASQTLTVARKDKKVELKVGHRREPPPPAPPKPGVPPEATAQVGLPFNNDGVAWRENSRDGNFDLSGFRWGSTFVADLLPPSGAQIALPGREGIAFRLGNKDDRQGNNVVCDGQRVLVPKGPFDEAWFLGAAHDGSKSSLLLLEYEKGSAPAPLHLTDWCAKPDGGTIDVLRVPARHGAMGQEEKLECGLVAWRVPLDRARKLLAIHLPRERSMHVFALTLVRSRK